ncbi:MAG: DNA polymerase III subunit delta' [Candidatus Cloacimonetes bacterium 4572_55]|nr:MAG: DNA polymerase III subunit delta' [Candidatus Cloacimonetes bacterium 4572_55]
MSFSSIIGQEAAIGNLQNAFHKNRASHAYIFHGSRGVGKETTALAIAKWLNCHNRSDSDFCGSCPSCRKIRSFNHLDVKFIFPRPATLKTNDIQEIIQKKVKNPDIPIYFDQNVSIVMEDIREMQRQLSYPPYEAKTRVIIIREAEKMSVYTANALLKTLEEPPERTLLILTANHLYTLLQTIRSRCQQVRFRDLLPEEIEKALRERYHKSKESARLLSHIANGSLGHVIGREEKSLMERREAVLDLVDSLPEGDPLQLIGHAEKWLKSKESLDSRLQILSLTYRDIILLNQEVATERYLSASDLKERLSEPARKIDFSAGQAALSEIDQVRMSLTTNVNQQLALLHLFFTLRNIFHFRSE